LIKKTLVLVTTISLFSFSKTTYAQAPDLGSAATFVLFSSDGAVSNSGSSQVTGNVGTNNGSSTAFGNVNGVMHDNDGASAACMADLLVAYGQLNNATPTLFPAPLLGNGQTLDAGIYSIAQSATLNLELILDAENNPEAVFIFQIEGSFSVGPAAKVTLINGAKACNVFWKAEGLVTLAPGSTVRGTIIANNAAINMGSGITLEGRALSTTGAITISGALAYLPTGCGSPLLTGPYTPNLGSAACYALFSSNGSVSNTGSTFVTGDIGTNTGSVTGYDQLNVTGTIHPIPDGSTAMAATDLLGAYNYINTLPHDIELLYPAQFGNGLVLTPHTYLMNGAATFTDTVFLNAEGNVNAIFIIKINGMLSSGTYAKVKLINGTQSTNVYWKVEGAVNLADYSEFAGTIISNNGAISGLSAGTILDGRALTTNGALTTASVTADMGPACAMAGIGENNSETAAVYPNPFTSSLVIRLKETSSDQTELRIFTVTGKEMIRKTISEQTTVIEPELSSGIYYYEILMNGRTVQSGKIVSQL